MKQICVGIAVLGVAMLLLGFAWGFMFPPERAWTPEKAELRGQLQTELHGLLIKVTEIRSGNTRVAGDEEPGEIEQRYKAAKQSLDELNGEFESATESPKTIANVLRIVGMLLVLGGLIGLQATGSK